MEELMWREILSSGIDLSLRQKEYLGPCGDGEVRDRKSVGIGGFVFG